MKLINVTPEEYRGTKTCKACGCAWVMEDISGPNPIQALCFEPLAGQDARHWSLRLRNVGCDCHNPDWVNGYLDQRAKMAEEVVLEI